MDNWNDKITVKKGNIGELIVDQELERRGFIIFKPTTKGAHGFDRLCVKDKRVAVIGETKTKAKREYYDDTGINYSHYLDYKRMFEKYNLDTLLFFVDEQMGKIYYNKLSVLDVQNVFLRNGKGLVYPLKQGNIIYFHMDLMITLCKLTGEQVKLLSDFTTKNKSYLPYNHNAQPQLL